MNKKLVQKRLRNHPQLLGDQSTVSQQMLHQGVPHLESYVKAKFDKLFNIHPPYQAQFVRSTQHVHASQGLALQDAFIKSVGADVAFWFCHNCHGILEVTRELFPIHESLSTILASKTILSHALPHANTKLR